MTTIQIILLTLLSGLIMIDFMSAHLTVCNTITTGIVAGVIMGNPTLGLIVGATLQSYALGLNYFGGASIPNYQVASIIVVALCGGNLANVPETIALIGIPVAALTVQLDVVGRVLNSFWQHQVDAVVPTGNTVSYTHLVKYAPLEGRYKVYIIDEVHMMSSGAFNSLLKTLEEPPSHVIFMLATTEPQKVLPTIISRCQRYDFSKVGQNEIITRVRCVLEQEHIECEDEALRLVAQLADGGMRDALSIMDQCIAYAQNHITAAHVNEIYGITTVSEKIEMLQWIFQHQAQSLLEKIRLLNGKGVDIKRLTSDLIEILKECVIFIYTQDVTLYLIHI